VFEVTQDGHENCECAYWDYKAGGGRGRGRDAIDNPVSNEINVGILY
jgi:hypothetical protein